MSGLRVSMLGGFAVLRDGVTLIDGRWPRKKPAALLKLLALNPRRRVPRERVIDVLWPQADEESGANNLSKALHYIRSELGESANAVRSEQGAVVLDATVATDVQEFEQLASEAKRAPDDIAAHHAAVGAYAGHLLPDDSYEWLEPPRARLRDTWRSLRLRLCQLLIAAGCLADGVMAIEPVVAGDPADEQAQAAYIRALALSGDRNAALRQYDLLRDALYDELAVTPSPETVALREEIAANLIAPVAPAAAVPRSLEVRHTLARDGVRIGYATYGARSGIPLVMMPLVPWSDLLVEWEYDEARAFVEALASRRPVVRYDSRALGQSQREVSDISIDAQVSDLEAVADTLKLETFDLFAGINSGPQAFTYVARHPDRVRRIVCYDTWYDGPSWMKRFEDMGLKNMARSDWEFYCETVGRIAVGHDASEAFFRRHLAWLKTTPRDLFEDFRQVAARSSATELLPHINQPVLGIAPRYDLGTLGEGHVQGLARLVPSGRLYEGDVPYVLWATGSDRLLEAIHEFLDAPDEQPDEAASAAAI